MNGKDCLPSYGEMITMTPLLEGRMKARII